MNTSTTIKRLSMATLVAAVITVGLNPVAVYALPTANSSSLRLEAEADAGSGLVTDIDSDSQFGTTNPLSVSVRALATSGNARVLSQGSATATWTNSSEGVVNFSNLGWTTTGVNSGSATLFRGLDWSYEFVSDATGFFTLDYNTSDSGTNTFGLNGFNFLWSGPGGDAFVGTSNSGTIQRAIFAGQTYTVGLRNQANIFGGLGTRESYLNGRFNWKIDTAAVPEPSAMLGVLAFSALGFGSLRKPSKRAAKE
ncbi:MAG TPA: PEP-CTERM sorting domain-containing protein [Nostocaceae cyanobacterium]|nr:PEP-CTERM sorting domain-containing protein [Nostocaceae cyanobacterium]